MQNEFKFDFIVIIGIQIFISVLIKIMFVLFH